tara:strand:+ start:371 stop:517 length:147 start_codon:yes stop_codon:yes gene_type:complete
MSWENLVSNVGFPIAAFFLMFHFSRTTVKENTSAIKDLKDAFLLWSKK